MTRTPPDVLTALRQAAAHHDAARHRLHLVPSENGLSLAARVPHLTEAAVRYAFPGPDGGGENWAWPGRQDLVDIERAAAVRIGAQLGARHVNLKPVSGVSALTVALSALARPGARAFNLAERDGGHGSGVGRGRGHGRRFPAGRRAVQHRPPPGQQRLVDLG